MIKTLKSTISILILTSFFSSQIQAKNYFVSITTGSNNNNGLSEKTAKKTIQSVVSLTEPGDTVFILNGTYSSTNGPILNLKPTNSGTETSYIVYKALAGHQPKIFASGNVWNAISINASYIVIDGLELEGNNANITYKDAYQSYQDYLDNIRDWSKIANFNTNALTVGGPNQESSLPHHVLVRNCIVHDFPGGGLNSIQADYTTFENNLVYNNAWYMMYAGSGISILNPYNSDTKTAYRNIVRNNICHTNKTTIPWVSGQKLSDGNGIIIDVNVKPYSGGPTEGQGAYQGRTLVENNLSINNGGSGMHCYLADHVDIVNNTAYHNGTMVDYPDIFTNQCKDVNIINNIMYARVGGKCNSRPNNTTEIYDYNIYFNGTVGRKGPHDKVADPNFINLSLVLNEGNFRLTQNSPAVNAGTSDLFAANDLDGQMRPIGSAVDCGAYEFNQATSVNEIKNEENSFRVFPNPALQSFNIERSNSDLCVVKIFNLNGVLLKSFHSSEQVITIQTARFDSGIYLVQVADESKMEPKKIVINRL